MAALLTNLQKRTMCCLSMIHRLSPVVEEILYPAMEDLQLDIMIGEGPGARSTSSARSAAVHARRCNDARGPAHLRCQAIAGIVQRLEFYDIDDLEHIVVCSARSVRRRI